MTAKDAVAEYEQQAINDFKRLAGYANQEPALVLTLFYMVASFAGLLHLGLLMSSFDINVLPHLELSDFLLGAIYYPEMFVYFAFYCFAVVLMYFIDRFIRARWTAYNNYLNRHAKAFFTVSMMKLIAVSAVMYLAVAVEYGAEDNYQQLIDQKGDKFDLYLASPTLLGDSTVSQLKSVQLIANLSKHLWIYNAEKGQVYTLPHDTVVALSVVSTKSGQVHQ